MTKIIGTRLIGVNGIASNGVKSTDVLLTALAEHGFDTLDFNYPRINLFEASWVMSFWRYTQELERLAGELFKVTKDGDHVVAHSFGCAVVWHCMSKYNRHFGKVWLIAPAMSLDDEMMPLFNGTDQVTFVHNPHDRALRFARFLPWIDMSSIGLHGLQRKREVYEPPYRNLSMPFRYLRGETKDWLNHSYAFGRVNLPTLIKDITTELSS